MTKADDFLAKLTDLYGKYGGKAYGKSPVTNLQHSLQVRRSQERPLHLLTPPLPQAALLAQNEDGRREMVVAALLHDVGHLVEPEEEYEKEHPDEDFAHETLAVGLLGAFLPPAVVEPIRLHVDAKRYLVAVDKSYYDILSGVSHVTLKLQGGPFNAEQGPIDHTQLIPNIDHSYFQSPNLREIPSGGMPFSCASGTIGPRLRGL